MVIAAIAVMAGLLLQDVDNPEYKQWSKFKPGTSVKFRMEMEASGQKMVQEITHTLKSVDDKKIVLSTATAMTVAGMKMDQPARDRDIAAKIPKGPEPDAKAEKPETGEEEIEAAGKKWKCKWMKMSMDIAGTKQTTTTWTCEDVPGQIVKMAGDGAAKQNMILVEIKQP